MTTPLLLRFMKGTELEPWILQSEFLRRRGQRAEPLDAPRDGQAA
jgi:hypothetical protein